MENPTVPAPTGPIYALLLQTVEEIRVEVFAIIVFCGLCWFLFRPKTTRPGNHNSQRNEAGSERNEAQRWDLSPPPRPSPRLTGPGLAPPPSVTLKGHCWVIDGDTIVINKLHIRLAGIDAPELDHPWGQKAKYALVALCKGQTITAVTDGSLSHERTVAQCFLPDERDLSAEMVKSGHAIDWDKFSGGRYRELEVPGIRQKMWRATLRQQGKMPPSSP